MTQIKTEKQYKAACDRINELPRQSWLKCWD